MWSHYATTSCKRRHTFDLRIGVRKGASKQASKQGGKKQSKPVVGVAVVEV
jgi:hypothetical protein